MIIALMALLGTFGAADATAATEIQRILAQAGFAAQTPGQSTPLVIAAATQEYGVPTRDACCHTFTPLRIGTRKFEKGIGAHSNGRIVVKLNEPASSFHAWVGIDNNSDTAGRGTVVFSVLVDGQERYRSPLCRGADEPHEVNVGLAGAHQLELLINDGGDGISFDQADWAEASVTTNGAPLQLSVLLEGNLFRAVPTSFDYDGKNCWDLLPAWRSEISAPQQDAGRATYRRTWTEPESGFQATLCITVHENPAACELHWELAAGPDKPSGLISGVRSIDFSTPARDKQVSLFSSSGGLTGNFAAASERTGFLTQTAPLGRKTLASTGGRSSNGDLPFFMLSGMTGGINLACGIAWSGQWKCDAAYDNGRSEAHVTAGIDPCEFRIPSGERIAMPGALLVPFSGDTNDGSNALRRALRTHFAAHLDGQPTLPPVSFNSWFVFTNNVNGQMLCELADASAGLGLDYFCLDSGWFDGDFPEGVGNWTINAAKFPNGLRAVADHVHQAGMKFGLWFEPERVADGTRWQREHPEWLLGKNLLNLGEPGVRTLILDMMSGIINEVGVDWIRFDFNIDPLDSWLKSEGPEQHGLCQLRYVNGLYALLDELMRRHPGLFIEQCAGGGRRIDLETIRRGHSYWKSDETVDLPILRFHETGANCFLPGGFLNTNYCRYRSQSDILALFAGPLGFGLDFRALEPQQKDAVRQAIAAYRQTRRFINEDYYPLFAQSPLQTDWLGWQFMDPSTGEGFITVYRPAASPYGSATVSLRGLTSGGAYVLKDLISGEERTLSTGSGVSECTFALEKDAAQVWLIHR